MKVISWNVNSVNVRLSRLLALLERESPDVVCLQELKCTDEKFPFEPIRGKGYHVSMFGQKTYNGVAVLSKVVPRSVRCGLGDDVEDPSARLIMADFGKLKVLSAYIPNGQEVGAPAYDFKLNWFSRLKKNLTGQLADDTPLVIAGDFNVAPVDLDVHSPAEWAGKILCSDGERAGLGSVVACGLVDTFRLHHPQEVAYSWWDYRNLGFPFNRGLRIDMIYASYQLAKVCRRASILRDERKGEKPSDHAPVEAEFDFSISG